MEITPLLASFFFILQILDNIFSPKELLDSLLYSSFFSHSGFVWFHIIFFSF